MREVSSVIERIKSKFDWLFGSHYKMERFGVMFFALLTAMALVVGSIGIRKAAMDKVTLGDMAVYTTEFTSSLSMNGGQLVNLWVNDSRTQCFILLHWDDMTSVVTDAADYEVYLTGRSPNGRKEALQCAPFGNFYVFGTTGYMGLFLVDMDGFPSQIINCIVRCNRMVNGMPDPVPEYSDASFSTYDQIQFFVNPGGALASTASFLTEGRMSVYDIYEATAAAGQEAQIRASLNDTLKSMQASLDAINEYTYRVKQDDIVVPTTPIQIRGDSITQDEAGNYHLNTDYVVQGAYTFDWQNGSIQQGYLEDVLEEAGYRRADRYIIDQQAKAQNNTMDLSALRWVYNDGTVFSTTTGSGAVMSSVAQTQKDIQNLTQAWSTYYNLKVSYQTAQLEQLLRLELEISEATSAYTVKTDGLIMIW